MLILENNYIASVTSQAAAAADTSGQEAEVNVLVYRLYKLTHEEVC